MFEEEIRMEESSSSFLPLILIIALILSAVGGGAYWFISTRVELTPEEASVIVTNLLESQGAQKVHFHTGAVKPSIDEKTADPHYKVLEKAGFVKMVKGKDRTLNVTLPPDIEAEFATYPEMMKEDNADGTRSYTVPLAIRKLVKVDKIEMLRGRTARVDYSWKWETTRLGDNFAAESQVFKSFPLWERTVLIDKYGSRYYHGEPSQDSVTIMKTDAGWKLYTD